MNLKKIWQFTLGGAKTPEECEALLELWETDPRRQALLAEFNRGMTVGQRAKQGLDAVAGMTAADVVRIYYRHGYLETWLLHQGDVKLYHKIMWWTEPKRYLALAAIGAAILFGGIGVGGLIVKAKAGRDSYGSVKNADLVEVAEECKDRMVEFKSVAERRYSDIGEAPSVEWVVEQTKDSPWMESCGTKCKKAGVYSIAIAKDEDGRDRIGVSCSVHGTDKDIHLGMDEGPEAARLCHHLQAERIVRSFEQPPVPDFRFDKLASGNYGCPTTGKLAIVANRTGELYDGIGEVVDVSGTKCSLHGDVFGCTEHEECVRLNEGLSEYRKKVAWKRKQEGRAPEPQPKPEPKAEPAPEPQPEPAPEPKAEPAPGPKAEQKGPTSKPESAKPASTPTPAKKTTLTDLADRQATAYKEGTKTVEQIIEVIKSPKLTEPQRKRLRELLEERGVPLAEAERKAREEAKRKAVEAKRQAAEEAKRKAAEEAEAKRKEAEAKRKEAEARKEAEFKERRQKAEAERLKRQEEDRKRREEADRLAKEEAEREQKRKDEEDRNRQKALDEIAKSMQKLSEAAARMDGRDDEEDDEEEEEEEDADTPFFRSGGVQTETLLEERRAVVEEQRRRAAAAEAQRRAAAAEAQRRAAAAEAQRRAAEQRKREEARKAQQMAVQADPYAISPFSGDGTIEDDEPQQLVPSVRSATPPAMPDAMVEQLAAGIKMSVQGGQMTAAQAAFMLDNATLSAAQKAKVRKLLAAEGIKLPGGK